MICIQSLARAVQQSLQHIDQDDEREEGRRFCPTSGGYGGILLKALGS